MASSWPWSCSIIPRSHTDPTKKDNYGLSFFGDVARGRVLLAYQVEAKWNKCVLKSPCTEDPRYNPR